MIAIRDIVQKRTTTTVRFFSFINPAEEPDTAFLFKFVTRQNLSMNTTAITTDIRKKAKKAIDRADDTTVKMILAMLEVQENEVEEENAFDKEMLKRFEDYEQGRIKTYSFDELAANARNSFAEYTKAAK